MSRWSSAAFLDGGLDYLAANATAVALVKNYTPGDNFATITSNKIAEAALNSGDFSKSSIGSDRRITSVAKTTTASASSAAGDDLHFVFHNGTAPIYVTDESTNQVITSGNSVQIPALRYTSRQPTAEE